MCQPRNAQSGITKALIKALIDYSRENNQTLALFSSGHKRPQPFFFRKTVSSKLHPKQLESWWRFLFENQSGSSLCSWSPSVDNRKCPLPFAVANEERDANEVVPLFPDDPMSRHLSTFDNEPIELSTFLESLSYRPEYVGGAGTHFWLSPSPNCYSPHCEPNQGGPALNRWIDSVFCKIDFSSIALAYESTNILIDAIEKIHNGGEEIEVVRFSVSNLDLHARAKDSFYTNKSAIDQTSPPINNIQKLIRKNKST
ncbi:hypothetical protein DI09_177p50 [Mitosporidium daphniae]|uniref:histone acetyltransferase n=1 Tax=Mitosporidium daphniae TaxID=1485682 RepID=A0A098VUC8_9MICR|nr:hypothetical protein DI09_177p50 [Mitosporidium daphniae]|eukprot:XP_013238850.1 uncharacterized protein DI09_177p50 [Mitosporidium daphniae]